MRNLSLDLIANLGDLFCSAAPQGCSTKSYDQDKVPQEKSHCFALPQLHAKKSITLYTLPQPLLSVGVGVQAASTEQKKQSKLKN